VNKLHYDFTESVRVLGTGERRLIVDAVYLGGTNNNSGDDALAKSCDAVTGRLSILRTRDGSSAPYVVLYSTLADLEWPDTLDTATERSCISGQQENQARNSTIRIGAAMRFYGLCTSGCTPTQHIASKFHPSWCSPKRRHYGGRAVQFRGLAAPGGKELLQAKISQPYGNRLRAVGFRTTKPYSRSSTCRRSERLDPRARSL